MQQAVRRWLTGAVVGVSIVALSGCGTMFYPERKGQLSGDVDPVVAIANGVGLLFFIPGFNDTLRVNGKATIVQDDDKSEKAKIRGKAPKVGIQVEVQEVFLHCAKALMRARLWDDDAKHTERPIPSMGEMIRDQTDSPETPENDEDMIRRYRRILY